MSTLDEANMIVRHLVRRSDREKPPRDAERSDIANHLYGVGRGDAVTMAEVLRSSPSQPRRQAALVALALATYGGKAHPTGARTPTRRLASTESPHPRSMPGLRGVEYR